MYNFFILTANTYEKGLIRMKKKCMLALFTAALCCFFATPALADEPAPEFYSFAFYPSGQTQDDPQDVIMKEGVFDQEAYNAVFFPWAAQIPQPPVYADMADYALGEGVSLFRVTNTWQSDGLWTSPTADGVLIAAPLYGELFRYVEDAGEDWCKVRYSGGDAYIRKESGVIETTIQMQQGMDKRAQIVRNAINCLGCPYLYGGQDPIAGFDCSGFVNTIMKQAGISVTRTTKTLVKEGTAIDVSQIRPGDLIFFGASEETVSHVAIYIGNGQIIHAHSTGYGIRAESWNYKGEAPFRIVNVLGDQN